VPTVRSFRKKLTAPALGGKTLPAISVAARRSQRGNPFPSPFMARETNQRRRWWAASGQVI
jgi:hypothetical protein